MPFTLIKGTFEPSFGNPDGDSLRFVATNPAPIFELRRRGRAPRLNSSNGSIQLRYEGIDTMESRALEPFSSDATQANLDLAGTNGGTQSAPGYIYSNQIGPNGRPIAFVFAGDTDDADGSSKFLNGPDIEESLNVKLLRAGHAYPLFYDTLFRELREACSSASDAARADGLGVWPADLTTAGANWTGSVETLQPIFPKLWRRLDRYSREDDFDPAAPFRGFKDWLEQLGEERILVISRGSFTGFDDLVEATNTSVKLLAEPNDMIIVS